MTDRYASGLLAVFALACAGGAALGQDSEVEVLHWWTSGSEAEAINILKEDLAREGVSWTDMPVAGGGGEAATTTLKARVAAGDPPAIAQFLGMEMQEWAELGLLGDLSPVAEENDWSAVVPEAIRDLATHDGKWVGVPVDIHRPNWLWINAKIFEDNGLTPPATWEEFNAVAETLQDKGIIPLAHGGQAWQDTTIFDDVVLGLGGPDFYRAAIHDLDPEALDSDIMRAVFDEMRLISTFVDDNYSGRDWNIATAMLLQGEAGMQLMGDWAKGEITRAGLVPGEDVLCVPAPSTDGSFLFITDFFVAFDVAESDRPAQYALAKAALSQNFQKEFSMVKGSIPARTDISLDGFDACALEAEADLDEAVQAGTLIGSLAHGTAQTPAVQRAIFDVVTAHFNSDMSSDEAVEELLAAVEISME